MKNGFRVFDADTHVEPSAEVIDKYVDPGFRPRLPELAPYRQPIRPGSPAARPAGTSTATARSPISASSARRRRARAHSGRDTHWMGSKQPRPGVQDDAAESRIHDMDDEGTDTHFLIPTAWTSLVGHDDPTLEVGIIRAYPPPHGGFFSRHPDRLKSMIVASARDVDAAVQEIREWGKSRWAVAVMPLVTKAIPADHPSLDPIWRAALDHDLPIVHHSFTWTPPYFPGCVRSVGQHLPRPAGLASLGRDAVHRLGDRRRHHGPLPDIAGRHLGMRLRLAAVLGPPDGRAIRLCRLDRQLKMKPSEYLSSGRYFCSVERHEGDDMFDDRHPLSRRRRVDVRLRLSALGMPVPRDGREFPEMGR